MKISGLIFTILSASALCSADDQLFIDKRGALSLGGKRFQMVFFNASWRSYPQITPIPGLYRIMKKDQNRVELALNFPEAKDGELIHELKKTEPHHWTLCTKVNFPGEVNLKQKSMSIYLPGSEYMGLKLKVNGQEVICPVKPSADKKAILLKKQCRELRIPEENGEWIIRGNFHLLLQDNRYFRNGRDFELRLSFTNENPPNPYPAVLNLEIEYRKPSWTFLDISPAMNMGFVDEVANDGQGGWTDQGSENDLRMIWDAPEKHPKEFKILKPEQNNGKACIVLQGKMRPNFPQSVSAKLSGTERGRFLYLLHALAWRGTASDLGSIELSYADGTQQTIPVNSGRDADNWWRPFPIKNGSIAWIGENSSSFIGFYRSMFPIQSKPLVEIRFQSAGNAVWGILAATVGDFEIPRIPIVPHYILEGKNWKKLDFKKAPERGSVLDFSNRLDAPAGKYGPVIIRNGRFEFRDRPGIPARFYGTNICSQAVYPDRQWAEEIADRIAMLGFNAVRIHHHDAFMVNHLKSTELKESAMDKLDYLMFCLQKRGIYVQTDLFVSRRPAAVEIPGQKERMVDFDLYKALFYIQDSVFENWKQYVANYLNHKNSYTGFVVKDDPTLISLGLNNESNIDKKWNATAFSRQRYMELFEDFLKKRGIEKPSSTERDRLFNQFLTMLYQRRYRQMRDFVRSLGCTKALSDQNMGTSPHLSSMRLNYDFVDNHLYFNHPEFAGKTWGLPSFTRSHSVLSEYAEVPAQLFQSRIFGKPFMVTEFDFAKPNPHRADGALLFGVYGALQQWDGLFQFAYTHGMDKVRFMSRTDGYFDLMTDPVKLLSQYLGAAFFLNGELAEENSERNFGFSIPTRIPDSFEMLYPIEYSRIGLCAKIGGIPEGVSFPNVKGLPESRTELKKIVKQLAPKGEFCSAGGKVRLNPARQVFQVSTPRGEAFILPPGQAGQGDFCRIRNKIGSAVFGILSLDDLPLKSSKRMLLLHLTDSSAAKMRYADQDCRKLESWGTLPYLAARGEAEISLKPESGEFQLYAVDSAGKRLGEIPLNKQADGSLKAVLRVFQPFGQVFAYELRKKNILSTNNSQHF